LGIEGSYPQASFSTSGTGGSGPIRLVPSDRRVNEDMGTGDDFQNKLEDDLYAKKDQQEDPVYTWSGRIAILVLTAAFIFCLVMGCVALWKWVF